MNQQQIEASKLQVTLHLQGEAFQKAEIKRLRERCANQYRKIENLQTACDFYQDKASTLEKLCVENDLMIKGRL